MGCPSTQQANRLVSKRKKLTILPGVKGQSSLESLPTIFMMDEGDGNPVTIKVSARRRGIVIGCTFVSYEAIDELKRIADAEED